MAPRTSRRGSSTSTSRPRSTATLPPSRSRCSRPIRSSGDRRCSERCATREEHLKKARSLRGDEREQVIADLSDEVRAFTGALAEHFPEARPRPAQDRDVPASRPGPGPLQLHLSWEPGRVIAWAAGHNVKPLAADELKEMLGAAGSPEFGWVPHAPVSLPGRLRAEAFAIPVGDVLGWLVAAGAGEVGDEVGAERALARARSRSGRSSWPRAARWCRCCGDARARRERQRVKRFVLGALDAGARRPRSAGPHGRRACPGSVLAFDPKVDARARSHARRSPAWSTRSAATAPAGSRCPRRRHACAPRPTSPRRSSPGSTAARSTRRCRSRGEIAGRVERWARIVTERAQRLVVRLDPPDVGGAWHLAVFARRSEGRADVDRAGDRNGEVGPAHLEDEIGRLERMLPARCARAVTGAAK